MKTNTSAGFSYIEIVMAVALFLLLAAMAAPAINQGVRNMEFAQSRHGAHLAANGLMLAVRDAVAAGQDANTAALQAAARHDASSFRVWVIGSNPREIASPGAPSAAVDAIITGAQPMGSVVVAIIFDAEGNVAGRSVGMAMGLGLGWLVLAFYSETNEKRSRLPHKAASPLSNSQKINSLMATKQNAGSAYIMVLIITMAVLSVAVLALGVSWRARNTSARYSQLGSLYHMAVAGSEQALEILNQGAATGVAALPPNLAEFSQAELIGFLQHFVMEQLRSHFPSSPAGYRHSWYMDLHIDDIHDHYRITTTITPVADGFMLRTTSYLFVPEHYDPPLRDGWTFRANVTARIIWQDIRLSLDEGVLAMVELKRVD
ncbi:MAG: hypothetical protein FWC78_02885 [Defluviitaleaceae bacterium]|nr:hypothetical protein [Defluviitaleaceae bacterium]